MIDGVLKNVTRNRTVIMVGSLAFIAYLSVLAYKSVQELKINKQRLILNDLQLDQYAAAQQQQ